MLMLFLGRNIFPNNGKGLRSCFKNTNEVMSYRLVNLLPILYETFEKLFLKLPQSVMKQNIIPNHRFGFRNEHGTTEQV